MIYIIDLFCGAGGLTTGASKADNVEVIACVNHDEMAIESHKANHPEVMHFTEDVRNKEMIKSLGRLVERKRKDDPNGIILLWASLECTNFSKAKGGLPRDADSRTLADCLDWYVESLNPDGLWIENVEEFMSWGPLDEKGKPVSRRSGSDYLKWVERIKAYGYKYDWKLLNAADYGAYTSRKRFFGQFIRKGWPMLWPEPTHAKEARQNVFSDLKKWKPVKEVLDFSDKGSSIFGKKKDLSENTLKRIYAGLVKFVANGDDSFLKKYYSGRPAGKVIRTEGPSGTIKTIDGHALVQCAFLSQQKGGNPSYKVYDTQRPSRTVTTAYHDQLIQPAFLAQSNGGIPTAKIYAPDHPSRVITTSDNQRLVQPEFLIKYHKTGKNILSTEVPASTVTTKDRMGVVSMDRFLMNPQYKSKGGSTEKPCFTLIARMDKAPPYLVQIEETQQIAIAVYESDSETLRNIKYFMAEFGISNIYMRMLRVDELLKIQGFPEGYILKGTKTDQKKFIGNAVEVTMGYALINHQAKGLTKLKEAVA